MLVKFNANDKFAEEIKSLTGQAVASRAFHAAAEQCVSQGKEIAALRKQLAALQMLCDEQQEVIEAAFISASTLVEFVKPTKGKKRKN